MIEDIEAALAFLAREGASLGIDGSRVVLLGRSAGGHLALTAAYTFPDRVLGVIAYYAPTDLPWSWETSTDTTYIDGRALIEALMGVTPAEAPDLYRSMSPIHLAGADSPPTLLLHGARDRLVSPQQGPRLAARLEELGVPHVHIEIPGATHGFDVAAGGVATRLGAAAVERFLEATLID